MYKKTTIQQQRTKTKQRIHTNVSVLHAHASIHSIQWNKKQKSEIFHQFAFAMLFLLYLQSSTHIFCCYFNIFWRLKRASEQVNEWVSVPANGCTCARVCVCAGLSSTIRVLIVAAAAGAVCHLLSFVHKFVSCASSLSVTYIQIPNYSAATACKRARKSHKRQLTKLNRAAETGPAELFAFSLLAVFVFARSPAFAAVSATASSSRFIIVAVAVAVAFVVVGWPGLPG